MSEGSELEHARGLHGALAGSQTVAQRIPAYPGVLGRIRTHRPPTDTTGTFEDFLKLCAPATGVDVRRPNT